MTAVQTVFSRSINEPIRTLRTVEEVYDGPDRGLIAAWERGRKMQKTHGELAAAALRGELPVLDWRGGISSELKKTTKKYGTLLYLATWQGLRNEDLNVDIEGTVRITCTKHLKEVIFNNDGVDPKRRKTTSSSAP